MFQRGFQPGDWRKWNCSHQPSGCGRISDQRHFFGNERAGFEGTVKGTCRHFTQLAARTDRKELPPGKERGEAANCYRDNEQLIRWYDREDHNIFDVCADDHCQRYQGITRASNPIVQEVIHETRGEILVNGETICDARFSKCCGGVTEQFEHCWEPIPILT